MNETIIEILIDNSGSMGFMKDIPEHEGKYLIEGLTRMTLIKKMLIEQIIPTIDYTNQIIIRTFRYTPKKILDIVINEMDLKIIYQGGFDRQKIIKILNSIPDPPMGGTPIAQAIKAAVSNLVKYPDKDRKIILITDGEENGGGDYIKAAKEAGELHGIPCKIFIIGLAQSQQSEVKSREIATGGYYNIQSKSFSANEIQVVLAPLKSAVLQNTISNIQIPIKNSSNENPSHTTEVIKNIKNKIEDIKEENRIATVIKFDELEKKLNEQIVNSQGLLNELASLKEFLRVQALLDTKIDSTTLTIDIEYSNSIRQRSESFLNTVLVKKYGANKVNWLNKEGESYENHDFEIIDDKGSIIKLIECKGTPKDKPTFYLTSDEWSYFLVNKQIYQLYRVFNVDEDMNAICVDNLFNAIVDKQVVPYLLNSEILKEGRVFLTLLKNGMSLKS